MINIDLSGKCAIVTGASQGIGMGCAQWLSRAGASVLLTARNEGNLKKNVAEINENCFHHCRFGADAGIVQPNNHRYIQRPIFLS